MFLILTVLGLRKKLVEAIPQSLISAISVGIGLFITFIGLKNLGIIIDDPVTLVKAANINQTIMIGLVGLVVMIFLEMKKVKGSLLIGIVAATILAMFSLVMQPLPIGSRVKLLWGKSAVVVKHNVPKFYKARKLKPIPPGLVKKRVKPKELIKICRGCEWLEKGCVRAYERGVLP